ncbi:nuclear transcription factor Y subunit beta isoform X1 [Dasypus novemcinctus]|uniref:nuclear transcription factor Y subunit beta isoform X1 n=1 Tax=Dasypus novemcinctus TaxID=9361 RepID=UPI00265F571A|nr:nuclear transcription factor Y subunit beta isoform X1 [Dasypus novemcinctus]
MSVSSRRRPRRQRRRCRGHSPPARPPARAGAGAGLPPARPLPLRAGPGSGRGAAARLFVRGAEERRDAGQAASRSPPPPGSGPEEGAPRCCPSPPLGGARGRLHFVRGAGRGGGGTRTPVPTLPRRSGRRNLLGLGHRAGVPGESPLRPPVQGPGRFVCPRHPGPRAAGGREEALGAGSGAWGGPAGRGDARHTRYRAVVGAVGPEPPGALVGEETGSLGGRSGLGVPAVWFTRKECSHLSARGPWTTCPKVEIEQRPDIFLEWFLSTTHNNILTVFHDILSWSPWKSAHRRKRSKPRKERN